MGLAGMLMYQLGLKSIGRVLSFRENDFVAKLPLVLKVDIGDHAATGAATTVDGTSYSVKTNVLKAGRAIRVTIYGTMSGTNAAKAVRLYIDDAAIATLTPLSTAVGNWKAEFVIWDYTDAAHQLVTGVITVGTNAGATTSIAADIQVDTTNFGIAARTIKTQVYSNHASDTITQKACVMELLVNT